MNIKEAVNQAFDLWQKTYVQIDKADLSILKKALSSKFITPEFIEYMASAGHREYTSSTRLQNLSLLAVMISFFLTMVTTYSIS